MIQKTSLPVKTASRATRQRRPLFSRVPRPAVTLEGGSIGSPLRRATDVNRVRTFYRSFMTGHKNAVKGVHSWISHWEPRGTHSVSAEGNRPEPIL